MPEADLERIDVVRADVARDDGNWLLIDKDELEVLGSLEMLKHAGHVPASLGVEVLGGDPLGDDPFGGLYVMRADLINGILERIPALARWVTEEFDARTLGLIYPAAMKPWWEDREWAAGINAQVAAALRELEAFLEGARASGRVVVMSIG